MSTDYQLLEALRLGIRVVSGRGDVLYENARLRELLRENTDAEALERAMHTLRSTISTSSADLPAPVGAHRTTSVATSAGRYYISASAVQCGDAPEDYTLLLSVERVTTELPSVDELRDRFGLTQREAEVALLLAHGSDNGTIAEALGVSAHTARHHTERILAKLGIRSRSGVMAAIVRGGRVEKKVLNGASGLRTNGRREVLAVGHEVEARRAL